MNSRAKLIVVCVLAAVLIVASLALAPLSTAQESEEFPAYWEYMMGAWDDGVLEGMEDYIHEDFLWYANDTPAFEGYEGWQFAIGYWRGLFPDLGTGVEGFMAQDDMFAFYGTLTGTHTGEMAGITPTENELSLRYTAVAYLEDGKVKTFYMAFSDVNWNTTLGLPLE